MNKNLSDTNVVRLPHAVREIIDLLEQAGYEAWAVGGFVRDALLNRAVHDCDLATSAPWQDVSNLCTNRGMKVFPTGTAHGTVTVFNKQSPVEVTTYRQDGPYSDARHPDSVVFVRHIKDDLARRDFTMNALAYHPKRGICDPYGGRDDIAKGIIRAVGKPEERFSEDALRILRALRFASELGFSIDKATLNGALIHADKLEYIAKERIASELDRLLCGKNCAHVLLAYPTILDTVLPELAPMRGFDQKSIYHIYDIYEHTAHVVEEVPAKPHLRWAALLHDCGKPECFHEDEAGHGHFYGHAYVGAKRATKLLRRLKKSREFTSKVEKLVRFHDTHPKPSKKTVKRTLAQLQGDTDLFYDLCALKRADALAHAPEHQARAALADTEKNLLDEILAQQEAFSLSDLAISGNDLLDAGFEAGPHIGDMLDAALEAVIEEKVPNNKQALLAYLNKTL